MTFVTVQLVNDGDCCVIQRISGNSFNVQGAHAGPLIVGGHPDTIELRWVLTPDLDGRQLQYRQYAYDPDHPVWSATSWKAVCTEFEADKLPVNHILKIVPVDDAKC